jgi:hypothetical protein
VPPYKAIFTTLGLQRLAEAQASGVPLVFTEVAVGDGGGAEITPIASMTALVNERARVDVNLVEIHPDAPNTVRVEGLIPAATGGFFIREAGLFNGAGELIAIASYPPIYKPELADGVSVDEYIRILLVYENLEDAIELSADLSVVIATRPYVDARDDELDTRIAVLESFALGNFGDGSDGDALLDGTNTYADWASKSGAAYTLLRDVYLNDLTITGATTRLNCHGFRIYVRGTLDVQHASAKIQAAGKGGAFGGTSPNAPGTIAAGGAGGAGGATTGTAGSPDRGVSLAGGDGGAGGTGTGGAGGAGGASVNLLLAPKYGGAGVYSPPWLGFICGGGSAPLTSGVGVATAMSGGAGGGGGGGAGGGPGGDGGAGGGVIAIAARTIKLAAAANLSAPGGAGATGPGANRGGGGGGQGGTVFLVYAYLTVSSGTLNAATCCPGGAGGASGGGSGTDGDAGSEGGVHLLELAEAAPVLAVGHREQGYITVGSPGLGTSYAVAFDSPFAASFGDNGYDIEVFIAHTSSSYDPVGWSIFDKTVNGFTIQLSDDMFTGEIRWKATSRETSP